MLQLLYLPNNTAADFHHLAGDPVVLVALLESRRLDIRLLGQKIKNVYQATKRGSANINKLSDGPGGRHDNDFEDISKISILPTPDEIVSTEAPFLRRATELDQLFDNAVLPMVYLENHFRLLREDMIRELKEDLQVATKAKKGYRKSLIIKDLYLYGVQCVQKTNGNNGKDRKVPWMLKLRAKQDLPQFANLNQQQRHKFVKENYRFLSHCSFACIICDNEVASLVTIFRDEDMLVKSPSIICVRISGDQAIERALLRMKTAKHITLIQMNTAIFAYEPVLRRLQDIKELPLSDEILFWKTTDIPH